MKVRSHPIEDVPSLGQGDERDDERANHLVEGY
jgi:hypothetical protein